MYLSEGNTKINSQVTTSTASSSVSVKPSDIKIEYAKVKIPGKASEVVEPRVSMPVAIHGASLTVKGENYSVDIIYAGSAEVVANTYQFEDRLTASSSERVPKREVGIIDWAMSPYTWLLVLGLIFKP